MLILALRLENVKSYTFAEFEFAPGANAIVGANGAGKSTILEAIGFTLFDSLPYNQRDFVREGEKTATVTVTFVSSHDERAYEVLRKCGGTNSYLVTDPETELRQCEGKADVQRFLRTHLSADAGANLDRLFSDAVGVPQGTFTSAFHLRPGERKAIFDPLLQVDEYDLAWSRLREPLALIRSQLQTLDVQIAALAARLEQLPPLAQAVTARRVRLDALAEQRAAQAAELEQVRARRQELDAVNAAINALDNRVRGQETALAGLTAQRQAAAAALAEAEAAQSHVDQHRADYAAHVAAQTRRAEFDAQVAARQQLRDRRAAVDKELSLARSELAAAAKSLEEVAAAEAQVTDLTPRAARQRELDIAGTAARAALTAIDTAQAEQERLRQEAAQLEARRRELAAQLNSAAAKEQQRQELTAAVAAAEATVRSAEGDMAGWQARAETVKQQIALLTDAATAACPTCQQPLTPDHRTQVLSDSEASLAGLRASYREAQHTVKAQTQVVETRQRELHAVEAELRRLPRAAELHDLDERLAAVNARLEAATAQQPDRAEVEATLAELAVELQTLGDPQRALAIAQATVARRPRVEQDAVAGQARVEAATARLEKLDHALAEFAALDGALATLTAELARTAAGHSVVLSHQRLAETVPARAAAVHTVAQELAAGEATRAELLAQLETARAGFDTTAFAAAVTRENELVGAQAGLQTEVRMLTETQQRDEQSLAELLLRQEELASAQVAQARHARHAQVLDDLRAILRQAGPFITQALIRQIGENAAQTFGELMQDFTRHLLWQEDYSIALEVEGNRRQFGQLSGGEQMSAALAVRLALLRELSGIDIAFFDEPTSNLDLQRREALAQQILNLDGLRQVFVISHDDTFEQATERLVRIEKVNGQSRAQTDN